MKHNFELLITIEKEKTTAYKEQGTITESRIYWLDNLRTFMIFLVVLLHAALVYEKNAIGAVWWIISEPSNPWINGIGNLFSKNFYDVAISKLNKGGMYCQWVQLYGLRSSDLKMIIKTFSSTFANTTVWHSNPADIMLIGSTDEFGEIDYQSLSAKLKGEVANNLRAYLNIYEPLDFLSYYMTGPDGVRAMTNKATLNTDDLPLLEFNAPFSLYADTAVQNNTLLQANLRIPEIKGYTSDRNFKQDFFFRKILNYNKLHIPVDRSWVTYVNPEMLDYIIKRDTALRFAYPQRRQSLQETFDYSSMYFTADYEDLDILLTAATDVITENNYDNAGEYLHRIEKAPIHLVKHSQFYARAGAVLLKANKFKKALEFLIKSNDINPYDYRASIALADLYVHFRELDLACTHYKKAQALLNNEMQYKVSDKVERYCLKEG